MWICSEVFPGCAVKHTETNGGLSYKVRVYASFVFGQRAHLFVNVISVYSAFSCMSRECILATIFSILHSVRKLLIFFCTECTYEEISRIQNIKIISIAWKTVYMFLQLYMFLQFLQFLNSNGNISKTM